MPNLDNQPESSELEQDRDLYDKWADRIDIAQKFRENNKRTTKWKKYIDYYKGDFFDGSDDTAVSVNLVHSNCKVLVASLASRTPRYFAKAKKQEYESREHLVEEILNNEVKQIGVRKTLKRIVRDSHIFGYGISKMGYTFKTAPTGPDTTLNAQTGIINEYIVEDSAYYKRVSPFRIFLDPDCEEQFQDSRYVIEAIFLPKEYVKKKFNIDTEQGTFVAEWILNLFSAFSGNKKKQAERSLLYEVWDEETKTYLLISIDAKKICKSFKYKKHPYRMLSFNEIPDEPYPISDVKLYESQQKEKNYIRTMMARHIKRFNRKYTAPDGSISAKELAKFEENLDGSVIMTKIPGQVIIPIQDASIQSDAYRYEQAIDGDVGNILGSTDVARGQTSAIRRSATEIGTADSYMQTRIADKQDVLDDYINDIGQDLLEIILDKYNAPRFLKIVGKDGLPMWTEWTKKTLTGEYDVFSKSGATAAVDKPLKLNQVMEGFKMQAGNPYVDQKELTEIFIKTVFEDFNNEKLMIRNAVEVQNDPIRAEYFRRQIMQKKSEAGPYPAAGGVQTDTGAPVAGQIPGVIATKQASEAAQPPSPQV